MKRSKIQHIVYICLASFLSLALTGCPQISLPPSDSALELPAPEGYPSKIVISEKSGVFVGDFKYLNTRNAIYNIGGTDASKFYIDNNGIVFFKQPPVYSEQKKNYSFTIEIYDGNKGKTSADVTVAIQDVDESKTAPIPVMNKLPDIINILISSDIRGELKTIQASLPPSINDEDVEKVSFYNRYNNYTNGSYKQLGDAQSIEDGVATLTKATGFEEGHYLIVAQIFLKNKKISSYSDPLRVTVDSTPPKAPTNISFETVDGAVSADAINIDKEIVRISASTEAFATVRFYMTLDPKIENVENILGEAIANGKGSVQLELISRIPNGTFYIFAQATDQLNRNSDFSKKRKIIITNPSNKSPEFSKDIPGEIRIKEGSSLAIPGNFTASDKDKDDKLTYSLEGPDKNKFTYTEKGELYFNIYPDFEEKTSAANSSTYSPTLVVTDTGGNRISHNLNVIIEDVEDDTKTLPPLGLRLFSINYDGDIEYIKNDEITKHSIKGFSIFAPRGSRVKIHYIQIVKAGESSHSGEISIESLVEDNQTYYRSKEDPDNENDKFAEFFLPITDIDAEYKFYATAEQTGKSESDNSEEKKNIFDDTNPAVPNDIVLITAKNSLDIKTDSVSLTTLTINEIPTAFKATTGSATDSFVVTIKDEDEDSIAYTSKENTKTEEYAYVEESNNIFTNDSKDKKTGTYILKFFTIDEVKNTSEQYTLTLVIE